MQLVFDKYYRNYEGPKLQINSFLSQLLLFSLYGWNGRRETLREKIVISWISDNNVHFSTNLWIILRGTQFGICENGRWDFSALGFRLEHWSDHLAHLATHGRLVLLRHSLRKPIPHLRLSAFLRHQFLFVSRYVLSSWFVAFLLKYAALMNWSQIWSSFWFTWFYCLVLDLGFMLFELIWVWIGSFVKLLWTNWELNFSHWFVDPGLALDSDGCW